MEGFTAELFGTVLSGLGTLLTLLTYFFYRSRAADAERMDEVAKAVVHRMGESAAGRFPQDVADTEDVLSRVSELPVWEYATQDDVRKQVRAALLQAAPGRHRGSGGSLLN